MNLHEAIEKLLQTKGVPMTANQISDAINAEDWYHKADRSIIRSAQIIARVNKYPLLFKVDKTVRPLLIGTTPLDPVADESNTSRQAFGQKAIANEKINSALKFSFHPVCIAQTRILILGTLPGADSLHKKEYYGNPRNRFWKVIARLAEKQETVDYRSKLSMLSELEIGLWDVVHSSQRLGSLDSAIRHERVNNLDELIGTCPNLEIIAFNGQKSALLYDRYLKRHSRIHYVCLPSTSPANASWSLERLYLEWKSLISDR